MSNDENEKAVRLHAALGKLNTSRSVGLWELTHTILDVLTNEQLDQLCASIDTAYPDEPPPSLGRPPVPMCPRCNRKRPKVPGGGYCHICQKEYHRDRSRQKRQATKLVREAPQRTELIAAIQAVNPDFKPEMFESGGRYADESLEGLQEMFDFWRAKAIREGADPYEFLL